MGEVSMLSLDQLRILLIIQNELFAAALKRYPVFKRDHYELVSIRANLTLIKNEIARKLTIKHS